ncbi:MAG: transporter associated domain-containing protein, partial [Planctomycetota bacterium]
YAKDLLKWLVSERAEREAFSLKEVLRPATFVPETKTVRELLAELLEQKVHIAFATDEYGGTAGIVTIEDIVEEVFGEIRDEYDREEHDDDRVQIDEVTGTAEIDARAEIDDANDALESIGLELPEHDDYDTVGGFVVTTMGKIPEAGEELRQDGLLVEVLEAEPTRVTRVRVTRASEGE